MSNRSYPAAIVIAAIGILMTTFSGNPALYAQLDADNTGNASGIAVEIGAGSNATVQYFTFTPQTVEINAGDSVTWTSPSEFSDIHTVTFVMDQNLTSDAILPFIMPNQSTATDFELLPPFNAGEPLTIPIPELGEAIVALNKIVWYPTVIDESDGITFLNGTDIQYTIDGTQKGLNSGIVVAPFPTSAEQMEENLTGTSELVTSTSEEAIGDNSTTTSSNSDMEQPQDPAAELGPPFPPISSFTVTFEEAGTYPYFCAIHPWMGGQVIVANGDETTASSSDTLIQ
jgi:plastocyanin